MVSNHTDKANDYFKLWYGIKAKSVWVSEDGR